MNGKTRTILELQYIDKPLAHNNSIKLEISSYLLLDNFIKLVDKDGKIVYINSSLISTITVTEEPVEEEKDE